MIPTDQERVLDVGLQALRSFGRQRDVRGRFIALYLGLRRMRDVIAPLGARNATPTSDIEHFLDSMFTKLHRPEPFVVLTAPFGGSNSANAPYSTRSGIIAPDHRFATNTWRNNFNIQKGVGCPAEAAVVEDLLHDPGVRLACPHIRQSSGGEYICSLAGAEYRGEEHSIWLRRTGDGYQVVDLDLPYVYEPYLLPRRSRIPVFALIAVLYSLALPGTYPDRRVVGIPAFAEDFHFSIEQVERLFDVDVESAPNASVLQAAQSGAMRAAPQAQDLRPPRPPTLALPPEADPVEMNTGLGAERLVATELVRLGWTVEYVGNQRGVGYDLAARRGAQTLCVEVKSSVGVCQPELTEAEWTGAQQHDERYVLAIVDFFGTDQARIWYVRDPAGTALTTERSVSVFRILRSSIESLGTEAEFL